MMNLFTKREGLVLRESFSSIQTPHSTSNILWIDLLHPSPSEVAYISQAFQLDIPTKEEREEIEQSARYWEDSGSITINTYFLLAVANGTEKRELRNETVTFLLCRDILFTVRYGEFRTFDEIQNKVLASPKNFQDGYDILSKIFEVRVEQDADMLESAARDTRSLRSGVFGNRFGYDELLESLASLQELNMRIRDSLFDKRRAITALLKTDKADVEVKKNLTIVLKDLNSLVEFATVNMNALDNIQSLFSSQINIQQNKIIKIFTVATVAFMPPTLIATIYGMNFQSMPELSWQWGYPGALLFMGISTMIPLFYFKMKKWL
ncbi:MAG: magnesium/cobalt transporter CorA [Wolinella sp.]